MASSDDSVNDDEPYQSSGSEWSTSEVSPVRVLNILIFLFKPNLLQKKRISTRSSGRINKKPRFKDSSSSEPEEDSDSEDLDEDEDSDIEPTPRKTNGISKKNNSEDNDSPQNKNISSSTTISTKEFAVSIINKKILRLCHF